MIFDKLNNSDQYNVLGDSFIKAFEFLKNTDLKNLKDGRYEIQGNEIYANIQTLTTKNKQDKKWEIHRDYIDIQYLITGQECMGYGIREDFRETIISYNKDKDIEFVDGDKFNYINLSEGEFVIFYPNDTHAPMLAVENPEEIKKVIVKIAKPCVK